MTRASLWTKHRGIALAIAQEWRIPGLEPDDGRQEALLALWCATATWDQEQAAFSTYARQAVRNRCTDLLRAATAQKRTGELDPDGLDRACSPDVTEQVEHREQLQLALDTRDELSVVERRRRSWRESKRRARAAA